MASAGLGIIINKQQQDIAIDQSKATAQSIAKQVIAERAVYTKNVIQKMTKDNIAFRAADIKRVDQEGNIPLPATFVHLTSAAVNKESGGHKVDLLSKWNINPEKGPRTPFESKALEAVARNRESHQFDIQGEGETARFVMVIADVASNNLCVDCHNNQNPSGWRKSSKTDFKINDVMGGLVVSLPLAEPFKAAKSNAIYLTLTLIGVIALMLFLIAMIQQRFVSAPLVALEQAADRISTGELDTPVKVVSEDEVGQLGKAFERMRVSLAAAMKAIEDKR
ncbi:MAG: DUF3365 domain-containing protein [Kofleriaceae bacterium]